MVSYTDAGFVSYYYWTSDVTGRRQFAVASGIGDVGSLFVSTSSSGLCTAP
jgi:hypothetical protein